jgi:phosphoglucosamine mutase
MGRLFGTDGVRGIANDVLTCERALELGRAIASVMSANKRYRPVILIGMDTRLSSDMLASAITAGLCSMGADVINAGVIPTPAVAYLIGKYKATAGIMISASHNPSEFNGIKIFDPDGLKLPDELEERIESIVLDHYPAITSVPSKEVGNVSYASNAIKDYVDHVYSTVPNSFEGLEIALDCANGAASVSAKVLFERLGAKCHILNDSPNGLNINENCGSTHMDDLRKYVVDNNLSLGVAFDGDADRCLLVDECGNIIDGDMIIAIMALDIKQRGKLAKNTVIGTIMSNFGFVKFCEENGIHFIATKVGDRYVLEEMELEGYCFGGEQSGHVIFREFASTGDGQLTAVQLLSHMSRSGKKLSELASVMKRYPQYMVNISVSNEAKIAFYTHKAVKKELENAKKKLGDTGRLVVRPSGTEPLIRVMAEGLDEAQTSALAEETARNIQGHLANY